MSEMRNRSSLREIRPPQVVLSCHKQNFDVADRTMSDGLGASGRSLAGNFRCFEEVTPTVGIGRKRAAELDQSFELARADRMPSG
jgi:hypothetical protein